MKIGILFSGQGAQKPGMGLDLLVDPLFAQTVAEASAATGLDITTILRSEHGELDQTANVQLDQRRQHYAKLAEKEAHQDD